MNVHLRCVSGNLTDGSRTCVGAPLNLLPDSSASMELYRHWLQKCELAHDCGISNVPVSMPSLALDVSDRNSVKLVQVHADLKERYIALSYCWGADVQTIMLTHSNKGDLLSGISPQRLDPTIRDAVTVAREMKFRLLWIDALCIFQDDDQWKMRELEIMGRIYENATFTIVVSAAKSVKEGFLSRRKSSVDAVGILDGHPQPIFRFQPEKINKYDETEPVLLRPRELDQIEHWYERGWTLQEMLFSGRRLQFRGNQTTWLCHCAGPPVQECDGWLAGTGHNYRGYSDFDFKAIVLLLQSAKISARTEDVLPNWYDLIEIYSSRKLSYLTDRLPAISAIAKEFASILRTTYICGLWKSDLARGLVWFPLRARHPVSGVKSGPSWSWASYEGAAVWWSHKRDLWRPNQDFEIMDDVIELMSTSSPFGEVKTAELMVRGLLLPISTPAKAINGDRTWDLDGREVTIIFDYPNDPRFELGSENKLFLLVLVNLDWVGAEGIVVLQEGEYQYSRVGWFSIADVWPMTKETRWVKMRDRTPKSQEELQTRLRSMWGGEKNIRQLTLI